jgi:hypothetical protein
MKRRPSRKEQERMGTTCWILRSKLEGGSFVMVSVFSLAVERVFFYVESFCKNCIDTFIYCWILAVYEKNE